MKKIAIAFAALIAAFGISSCNKEQIETPSTDIKLNIKVASLDESADTKAIKQDWVNGDKLNIWFDQINYSNPDLILTYDGTTWTAGSLNKEPNASGNLIVLYEGHNDWSKYGHNGSYMYPTTKYNMPPNAYAQPLAYTNNSEIAYTYESNTLSAELNSWKSLMKIQVVVTGLDAANASNYALKETDTTIGVTYLGNDTSIRTSSESYGAYTLGVSNDGGVAFCFVRHNHGNNPANWSFTLKDIAAGTEKVYNVSGKALITGTSKVAGVTIAASKFE